MEQQTGRSKSKNQTVGTKISAVKKQTMKSRSRTKEATAVLIVQSGTDVTRTAFTC